MKLQRPRLDTSSSNTSVYHFMTSSMQGWPQLSDRGCIWRNAEVLIKRCHFPCSIVNLPVPSADGITVYQQLMWEVVCDHGSASASMSLTFVSLINGRGVPPSLHTRPEGRSVQPLVFWQHQCRVRNGPAPQQYLAVFDMATVLPLVTP